MTTMMMMKQNMVMMMVVVLIDGDGATAEREWCCQTKNTDLKIRIKGGEREKLKVNIIYKD